MNKIEQAKRESVTSYYYADVNLYDVQHLKKNKNYLKELEMAILKLEMRL